MTPAVSVRNLAGSKSGPQRAASPDRTGRTEAHIIEGQSPLKRDRDSGAIKRSLALVDDDRDLVATYLMVLDLLGYEVIPAFDGDEIVEEVRSGKIHPEVIIMDYRMPKMDGLAAARAIRAHNPKINIIIASADDSIEGSVQPAGFIFLQKPFTIAKLSEAIKKALNLDG